jgi:DNA-binding NtrC family response regulator
MCTITNANDLLILDDSLDICLLVEQTAKSCRVASRYATSRAAFYAEYRASAPALLLLDVILGKDDVCEVLDFLAARQCTAPLFLMSAYDYRIRESVAQVARNRGLHVAGTFDKRELAGRLRSDLASYALPA